VPTPRAATLPSPYLLSRAAVYHGEGDRNNLMRELAGAVIRPVAERLVGEGYDLVHLEEPWVAFHGIEAGDWKPFQESVALITDGLAATTVLHTTFGDGAPLAERLRQLPVDAIGFDCTETDVSELGTNWEQGVLLGCIDGRRSLVDPVDAVVALVERVAERLRPPRILLSSAGDLELVPADLARQKVLVLGEATRVMKEHAG
jgi:methionine synthase II (cobalamin-independent)